MSLLSAMAGRFVTQTETLATAGLGYLANESSSLRRALVAWSAIEAPGRAWAVDGGDLAVLVEHVIDSGRADLAAVDRSGAVRLIIEAKFDAGLQSSQPNGYLQDLAEDGVLLFLVPERRRTFVHAEVRRRLESLRADVVEVSPWTVRIGPRVVTTQTWGGLLERLSALADADPDPGMASDIVQLRGLADRMDREAFVPLSAADMTGPSKDILTRVRTLHFELEEWAKQQPEIEFLRAGRSRANAGGWACQRSLGSPHWRT